MFTISLQYLTQCNMILHDVFWRKFSKDPRFVHLRHVQKCVLFFCFFVNILAESTALGGRAGSVLQLFPIITVHTLGCETRPFSQYQVVMH